MLRLYYNEVSGRYVTLEASLDVDGVYACLQRLAEVKLEQDGTDDTRNRFIWMHTFIAIVEHGDTRAGSELESVFRIEEGCVDQNSGLLQSSYLFPSAHQIVESNPSIFPSVDDLPIEGDRV